MSPYLLDYGTIWSALQSMVLYLGIPVIIGVLIHIGRKLQVIDDLKSGFNSLQTDVRDLISRISKMEGRLEGVSASASPVQPTELGAKYIRESGLENILNENKNTLFDTLKKMLPANYAEYDVQESARRVMMSLKDSSIMRPVKEYAFKEGIEIEVILGVGGLWLRDDFLNLPRGISKAKTVNS